MLNLVELGSNYLPLIHIMPKMRFVFISGAIIGFRRKRGLQKLFQGRLEVRGSLEHQGQQSRGKQRKARACDRGVRSCTRGRTSAASNSDAWPAMPGRTAMRLCMGDRALVHGLADVRFARFCVFRSVYFVFLHFLGGLQAFF